MNAYLYYPSSGSVFVDPLTEILVAFENPYAEKEQTNIKIDGEWAVVDGEVQDGFINTRYTFYNDIMQWGLRKRGGLKPRDIVVSAWCGPSCAAVEQRFYVRGAKCKATLTVPQGHNWCRAMGGVFSTEGAKPFPDRVSLDERGKITIDDRHWYIPSRLMKDNIDIARHQGSWILCASDTRRTYVAKPNRINIYNFSSKNIRIAGGYINAVVDSDRTIHLPTNYLPASTETKITDWFSFQHDGNWKHSFENHIHLWWNDEQFIAKHHPRPMIGKSDDMLWTSKDIKEDIETIKVVDSHHVLVNNSLYINTYHPEITRIK